MPEDYIAEAKALLENVTGPVPREDVDQAIERAKAVLLIDIAYTLREISHDLKTCPPGTGLSSGLCNGMATSTRRMSPTRLTARRRASGSRGRAWAAAVSGSATRKTPE